MYLRPGLLIFNRFELKQEYFGGVSRVFRAFDRKKGHFVVLKFLPEHLISDKHAVEDLVNEAKLASTVKHNNVLQIENCYQHMESGVVFIVMELAEGGDLADLIHKKKTLTWDETKPILDKILAGVYHIHKNNIIHRDLKPKNVFFRKDGSIAVADFGISKSIQTSLTRVSHMSSISGTPNYMAPEAIQGKDVGFEADIYSIGCLAYELLAGDTPFTGDQWSIMYKQVNEEPDYTDIPDDAVSWIRMCLEKDAKKRAKNIPQLRRLLNIPDRDSDPTEIIELTDDILANAPTNLNNLIREHSRIINNPNTPKKEFPEADEPMFYFEKTNLDTSQSFNIFWVLIVIVLVGVIGYAGYMLYNSGFARGMPKKLVVSADGAGDFSSISDAMKKAQNGDTLFLRTGTYFENVIINNLKNVTIIGEGTDKTIIRYRGNSDAMKISSSSNISLAKFNISYTGSEHRNSISVFNSSVKINDIYLEDNSEGHGMEITGSKSSINMINSTGAGNEGSAVRITSSAKATIRDCNFHYNSIGVESINSAETSLQNVKSRYNKIGATDFADEKISSSKGKINESKCDISLNEMFDRRYWKDFN